MMPCRPLLLLSLYFSFFSFGDCEGPLATRTNLRSIPLRKRAFVGKSSWTTIRGGENLESTLEGEIPPHPAWNETTIVQSPSSGNDSLDANLGTNTTLPKWKLDLPEQLRRKGPKTLQKIRLGQVDIYLLGTAHVSNDSSADTKLLLEHVQPDAIMVELCDSRIPLLEGVGDGLPTPAVEADNTTRSGLLAQVKSIQQTQGGSHMQALSTALLTSIQEEYAKELGVELGGEFRCAYRYWQERAAATVISTPANGLHDRRRRRRRPPHLILGDRPMHITLVRAWESLWWWPRIKVLLGLLWSSLFKPNKEEIRKWLESVMKEESDILTESFQELRKHFPTLYDTIIAERDAWLAAKLVQLSRALNVPYHLQSQQQEPTSIVAIVGAGHVPGICKWLTAQENDKTPEQVLSELVHTRRWAKDEMIQKEAIPSWVFELSEMQYVPPTSTP